MRDTGDRKRDRRIQRAGTQRRRDRDREQKPWDRHEDVHDARDDLVRLTSEITGIGADDDPEEVGDKNGGHGNEEGNASAVQETGPEVTAEVVAAHDVLFGGIGEARSEVLEGGVILGEKRRKDRQYDEGYNEDEADRAKLVLEKAANDVLP